MQKPYPPPIEPDPTLPDQPIPGIPGPRFFAAGEAPINETPISMLPEGSPPNGSEWGPYVQAESPSSSSSTRSCIYSAADASSDYFGRHRDDVLPAFQLGLCRSDAVRQHHARAARRRAHRRRAPEIHRAGRRRHVPPGPGRGQRSDLYAARRHPRTSRSARRAGSARRARASRRAGPSGSARL